jgi:hypothetical protein
MLDCIGEGAKPVNKLFCQASKQTPETLWDCFNNRNVNTKLNLCRKKTGNEEKQKI